MRKLLSFLLLSFLFSTNHFAQISFTNSTDLLANQDIHSGFVFGVSDLNGDGLDDIIRFNSASQAIIDYQNADNSFTPANIGELTNSDVWSVVIADVDEDGINDIVTGAYYEPIVMVKPKADGTYDISNLDGPDIFMQGASFSDINLDGSIDYFACNDDFVSNPYANDGIGNLLHTPELINTETEDAAFNSGNYACTWVDYDNDGDSDMYLAKCRLGVSDPFDGRRINRMFQNDGKGNFTDVAEEIGLRPFGQSWASEFGDIDNDGDMDAIIINHDVNTMLYENDGTGNYTEISIEAGIDLSTTNFAQGLQVYMYDFDNDTYLDIILTSYNVPPFVFRNNGNKTFSRIDNAEVFGTDINTDTSNDIQSGAIGDLNNDGFIDFILGFANGINAPNGIMEDRLYLNNGNSNNYIKIDLKGVISNVNGIGARVEVNGPWGTLIRDVKSGQGYGIMNSLTHTVGIGNHTEINNIVVTWPSGIVTVTDNPDINSRVEILEAIIPLVSTTEEICEGESIVIHGEDVDAPGVYSEIVNVNGMDTIYQTTLIVNPTYNINLTPITACSGQVVIINDQEITESGAYTINDTTAEGCDSTSTIEVTILDPMALSAEVVDDWGWNETMAQEVGSITLDMSDIVEPYSIVWSNGVVDTTTIDGLLPNDYSVEITDGNGCTQTFSFTVDLNTSLSELQEQGIKVYPIPTQHSLYIKDEKEIAHTIELFSIVGKRIISQKTTGLTTEINTDNLSSGIYILKIKDINNQLVGTTKVLKD